MELTWRNCCWKGLHGLRDISPCQFCQFLAHRFSWSSRPFPSASGDLDLTDLGAGIRLIEQSQPQEVYNLAAQSFVKLSFDQPITTAEITGLGAVNILEAIRIVNPKIRFYQASTSEMFGKADACHRMRTQGSIPAALMAQPSSMPTG